MNATQEILLLEALRRFLTYHADKPLQDAWTGLGTATTYKSVLNDNLMTYATTPNPRSVVWFKLTALGAAIVQRWIDCGITAEDVDSGKAYEKIRNPGAPKKVILIITDERPRDGNPYDGTSVEET